MIGSVRLAAIALLFTALACGLAACFGDGDSRPGASPAPRLLVYVGTYTGGESRGIYRFEFDPATGEATARELAAETENPSFLALHPAGRVLYAVNEVADFGGERTGTVSAFAIDEASGDLRLIGRQPSGGADPCHLVVDGTGRNLLVANYNGGSVAVLPLDVDGRPQPPSAVRRHEGSGPEHARQEGPHAHSVVLDAGGRFALSADLGTDRVYIDRFDAAAGSLQPNDPDAVILEPGSGPRQLAWHPAGEYLYLINELRSMMTVFRFAPGPGGLDPIQTITTLPEGFAGKSKAAGLAVSPDGRFLYGSNRGHDSLALFAIDARSGRLTASGQVPSGGRTPRHFAISPGGDWLLVANQDSGTITTFHLDRATGLPTRVGPSLAVPEPACLLFVPGRTARQP